MICHSCKIFLRVEPEKKEWFGQLVLRIFR